MIKKDSVVVNYSKANPNKKLFVMPCNYYGCQIDHEFIYGEADEVIPYLKSRYSKQVVLIWISLPT